MTARRFDPAQNRQEFERLYGVHTPDWDRILSLVTVDRRDQRDPKKIGQRILWKVAKRNG